MKPLVSVLLAGFISGCDRAYYLQGLAFESDAGSYEFLDSQHELRMRAEVASRLVMMQFRMFEKTREGPKEWSRWHRFYPVEGDDGNFLASWLWGGWGEREWDRVVVEKEGFEPLVIPGDALTRDASRKFLLIRMKRLP